MISPSLPDRSVWQNGPFVRLWIAQAITQTAQNALWYALLVIVEELSRSTTQLGITILSVILPSILFGVPAGVYVDRWDKRTVLVVTNLARAFIAVGYIVFGSVLGLLYAVSFVFSLVSQFFAPAELAMIPAVVARQKLMQATSLFHLTFTASQLLGLVFVGPLIVKVMGTQAFFMVTAVLYGGCAVLVRALPRQAPHAASDATKHPGREMVAQLREVQQLLLADRVMLWSMGYWTMGVALTLIVAMVAPRFVVDVLRMEAADTVFLVAPGFVGAVGAAALLSRSAPGDRRAVAMADMHSDEGQAELQRRLDRDRYRMIRRGLVVVAVALGVIGGLPALGPALGFLRAEGLPVDVLTPSDLVILGGVMVAMLVGGFGFTVVMVAAQTSLQERAPPDARGRVFAVLLMLANLVSVVPLMFVGGLADVANVGRVLLVLAVAVAGVALLSQRWRPASL